MLPEPSLASICAQVNASFEVRTLVEYIGYHPGRLMRSGEMYLAFCPVHQDTVFRSLELNPRNNTYQCQYGSCPAHGTADFLDLLVRVKRLPLPVVIEELVAHFGDDYFRLHAKQLAVVRTLARQARGETEPG